MYVVTDKNGVAYVCDDAYTIMEWISNHKVPYDKALDFMHEFSRSVFIVIDQGNRKHYPLVTYTHAYRKLIQETPVDQPSLFETI